MPTVLYANGLIPQDALDPIPAAGGQTAWLLPIPAASFMAVAAECQRKHGWSPEATSAGDGFRSLQRQINVFRQRYRPTYSTVVQGGRTIVDRRRWNGVDYWRFTGPAAAVPGTSNHGKGITVDVTDLGGYTGKRFDHIEPILVAHGWSNAEGRSIGESWHWNYTRTAYEVDNTNKLPGVHITPPGGTLPGPLKPEDDLDANQDKALTAIYQTSGRLLQILEALEDYVMGDGRAAQADDRVLGVLPDKRHPDGTVAVALTTADGQILRDDITASTARAVAETSSAFHQLIAAIGADGTDIDVSALADALAARLNDGQAAALAAELGRRLTTNGA